MKLYQLRLMIKLTFISLILFVLNWHTSYAGQNYGYGQRYSNYGQSTGTQVYVPGQGYKNLTPEEYAQWLREEKARKEMIKKAEEDIRSEERRAIFALRGETLADFTISLIDAYMHDTVKGRTRAEFINNLGNFLMGLVEQLDPNHPFHRDLHNLKTALANQADKEPTQITKHFAKAALQGELIKKYEDGIRLSTPSSKQMKLIEKDERYWPYYQMFVLQEVEKTEEECVSGRKSCYDAVSRKAAGFAQSVEGQNIEEGQGSGLALKIREITRNALVHAQAFTTAEKEKLYKMALKTIESQISQGAKVTYKSRLNDYFKEDRELSKAYKLLSEEHESLHEDESTLAPHFSYTNPWPKVKTPQEEAEEKRKKEEEERKRKEKEAKKKSEKQHSAKEQGNKIVKGLEAKGFGLLEKAFGKLFG